MRKSPVFVALAAAAVIAVAHTAIAAIGDPDAIESNLDAPLQQYAGGSAAGTEGRATPPAILIDRLEDAHRIAADAAKARVSTYVESLSQKVAANAARQTVTAYVESLSQKLAIAPPAAVAATVATATSESPARAAR